MTDEITRIGEVEPIVVVELVEMLELLLDEAKRGESIGMVACVARHGGEVGTAIVGDIKPFVMLGHLEFAKIRLAATRIDGALGDD